MLPANPAGPAKYYHQIRLNEEMLPANPAGPAKYYLTLCRILLPGLLTHLLLPTLRIRLSPLFSNLTVHHPE